jgi:hypothetical protein
VRFFRQLVVGVVTCTLLTSACGGNSTKPPPDIPGVVVERASGRNHVRTPITYPGKQPPSGGSHNPYPLTCGYYDSQPPNEFAVHSLEHGAVWIAYGPTTAPADVQTLKALAQLDHVIVSPYAGMDAPITVVAWEHRLELQSVSDPRLQQFVDGYRNGSQAPERGGACEGVGQPVP